MDHIIELKKRQLSQFKDKTNFNKWLEIIGTELNELEQVMTDMKNNLSIQTATGVYLDKIGLEILQAPPRPLGMSDNNYRAICYAQILLNTYNGNCQQLLDFFKILGSTSIVFKEYYDFCLVDIQYNNIDPLVFSPTKILELLESSTHPIQFDLTYFTDLPFVFDGDMSGLGFDEGELGASA
jgi:hypothetical protein